MVNRHKSLFSRRDILVGGSVSVLGGAGLIALLAEEKPEESQRQLGLNLYSDKADGSQERQFNYFGYLESGMLGLSVVISGLTLVLYRINERLRGDPNID